MLVQNGGYVINVTNPPTVTPAITAAVGDGRTDNTAAFQSVFNFLRAQFQASIASGGAYNPIFSNSNGYYVYIPNGTYVVSGTISYTGADQEQPAGAFNGSNFDINRVKIVGQSRAGTIIQLANGSAGFQNASSPQPVIAYQNMQTDFNNVPGENILRNITVNTGTGNPGAAGVFFQGANTSNMSNVTIESGDGQGVYGLWFKIGSNQGFYTDMTISGFQYGIYDAIVNTAEGAPAIEYVTLNNQTVAGIGQLGMSMSLRSILSNQSSTGVPALKLSGTGISTVMVDSNLTGGSSSQPAINMTASSNNGQSLFARNITTSGYGEAIQQGGSTVVAGPNVTEWVAYPVTTLFSGQATTSLNLPVVDTPLTSWGTPGTNWAEVDDYPSVQAAFNSGQPIIVFRQHTYSWSTDVTVPSTVQFINLMGAYISGNIDINTASSTPLVVQDGNVTFLKLEAQRNVVLRMVGQTMYNLTSSPVDIFLEASGNIEPSDSYGPSFCVAGQQLWARNGFDQENENVDQIIANGCTMWVFGFKTEQEPAGPFTAENGGSLEVLGGYVNQTDQEACGSQTYPLINVVNSNASATVLENQSGTNYCTVVSETRGGTTETASNSQFPSSGVGTLDVIPLYVGTYEGEFSVTPTQSSQTVDAGSGTEYSVTTEGVGSSGYTGGTIAFSILGLPSGASGSFSPTSANVGGSTTLTVTTSSTTPVGSYPLQIVGTSGSLARSGATTLVVQASSGEPAAPTNLTATAVNGNQINLTWTASSGATSYNVLNATASGGPYTTIATGVATTSYSNTGLVAGTTYYYVVVALNSAGQSPDSTQASATTPGGVPGAPTGLTATTVSASQINLSWNTTTGANSYNVGQSTISGGPYTTIATGVVNNSYSSTGLAGGTTYYYVVSAVNGIGQGANSAQASATTVPAAPTGLTASPLSSGTQIQLNWNASAGATAYTVGRSTTNGGPYTTLTNYNGVPASDVTTNSDTDDGLVNGTTYYYVVVAIGASGSSGNSSQASATAGATSAPAAPTSLTATAGNAQVALSWTASSGATSYNVLNSTTSGGPYTTVATGVSSTSYTNTGLTNGTTYYFVVQAVNSYGTSGNSNQASATPTSGAPAPPTGLSATTASTSQINLSWTASSGATSYNVLNSTTSGGPYTTVATGVATTSYSNTGLIAGTTYYYVVQAVSSGGTSGNSSQASAITISAAPTGLSATATSSTQINLTWTASTGAASYNVLNSTTSGGPYTTVATGIATTSYSNTGLTASTTYYYVVEAVNAGGTSANSSQASATTQAGAPAPPTGLTATTASTSQINLSWTASTGATSYNVLNSTTSGGPYTTVATGVATTSYSNTGLIAGTTYYYVVQAVSSGGTSGNSSQASAITISAAPTGLSATATSSSQINLSWTGSTGAASYSVGRSTTSGGPYTTIATGIATTSYSNTGLTASTTYYYVVEAVNAGGTSANSSQASATTQAGAPAPPTGLSATTASTSQINLSWTASSGATSYNVLNSTTSGGPYTTVATGVATTSYSNTGLIAGTTYYYVVQAVSSGGTSGNSSQASAITISAAPTGLSATATSSTQINLTWTASTGAASYNVLNSTTSGGPYTTVATGIATTSYSNTGLTASTTYYYVVEAVNAGGTSANSSQASATTQASGGIPPVPTGLTVTVVSTSQINLSWNASSGATSYQIARYSNGWTYYQTSSTTYSNTGLTAGTTYQYQVQAINSSGSSSYCTEVSGTTIPAAPTNLTATGTSSSQINLSWTGSTGATSYNVLSSTTSGGPYTQIATTSSASYSNTGLSAGGTYYYVVQAINASGTSANSTQATGVTIPAVPTGLTVTPESSSQINLSWNATTGATSYKIAQYANGWVYYTTSSPSYSANGLSANTTYQYQVEAINASGSSAFCSEVSGTTP
jgi:fibronectin type 3 domain-containing protein